MSDENNMKGSKNVKGHFTFRHRQGGSSRPG